VSNQWGLVRRPRLLLHCSSVLCHCACGLLIPIKKKCAVPFAKPAVTQPPAKPVAAVPYAVRGVGTTSLTPKLPIHDTRAHGPGYHLRFLTHSRAHACDTVEQFSVLGFSPFEHMPYCERCTLFVSGPFGSFFSIFSFFLFVGQTLTSRAQLFVQIRRMGSTLNVLFAVRVAFYQCKSPYVYHSICASRRTSSILPVLFDVRTAIQLTRTGALSNGTLAWPSPNDIKQSAWCRSVEAVSSKRSFCTVAWPYIGKSPGIFLFHFHSASFGPLAGSTSAHFLAFMERIIEVS